MRYYAIKISAGASTRNAGNTSGSAGQPSPPTASPSPASSSQVTSITKGLLHRQVSRPVSPRRLGFRGSALTKFDTATDDRTGFSLTINKTPQPWDTTLDPDITKFNVDFSIPKVPSSIQPVAAAPIGGAGMQTGSPVQGAQWTSVVNGQNDPGALDVEFDVELAVGDPGMPAKSHIKIRGIPFSTITQASKFTGCRLQMWAGFTDGLPLANLQVPHQGLILDGEIFPAMGNWVLNDLSLEFYVIPGSVSGMGGPTNPKNIVHNVPANQPFSTAIQNTLQTAFPNMTVNVNISPKIKLAYPDYGFYQSLEQYAAYIKALSHDLLGTPRTTGYQGVRMHAQGNAISVTDTHSGVVVLRYEDLVGQPVWVDYQTIAVKTLLRGDIGSAPFPNIKLPLNTLASIEEAGATLNPNPTPNILSFQGTWAVQNVRHIGKFRSPAMDAWVTVITAQQGGGSSGGTGSGTSSDAPNPPTAEGGKQDFKSTGEGSGTGSST